MYITYLHTSIACIKSPAQQSTHTYIHTYVYTNTLLYKCTYKITAQRNRPHHAATQLVRTHTCTQTHTHLCLHLFTCVHITSIQSRIAFIKPRPQHFAHAHTKSHLCLRPFTYVHITYLHSCIDTYLHSCIDFIEL